MINVTTPNTIATFEPLEDAESSTAVQTHPSPKDPNTLEQDQKMRASIGRSSFQRLQEQSKLDALAALSALPRANQFEAFARLAKEETFASLEGMPQYGKALNNFLANMVKKCSNEQLQDFVKSLRQTPGELGNTSLTVGLHFIGTIAAIVNERGLETPNPNRYTYDPHYGQSTVGNLLEPIARFNLRFLNSADHRKRSDLLFQAAQKSNDEAQKILMTDLAGRLHEFVPLHADSKTYANQAGAIQLKLEDSNDEGIAAGIAAFEEEMSKILTQINGWDDRDSQHLVLEKICDAGVAALNRFNYGEHKDHYERIDEGFYSNEALEWGKKIGARVERQISDWPEKQKVRIDYRLGGTGNMPWGERYR